MNIDDLRCVECGGPIRAAGGDELACRGCEVRYPVVAGTPRMLRAGGVPAIKQRTAASFAYEWKHFGAMRSEWAQNFAGYIRPHSPASLAGKTLLDVGAGSGRHSFHAARAGAQVTAVDLGAAIDVARRNLPPSVRTVQADAEHLPFERDSFDMVLAIGVLHHMPDPHQALQTISRLARPGGHVHIYVYRVPDRRWHNEALRLARAVRRVTVRLPHRVLRPLCYPLAAVLHAAFVAPCRALRRRPRTAGLVGALPLQSYADYPFGVLVNDQFDRFSAPLERRFTAEEVRTAMESAGLEDVVVLPHHGWIADGRRPTRPRDERNDRP